jgi:hypothetical protein
LTLELWSACELSDFDSPSWSRHERRADFSEASDWHFRLHSISLRLSQEISLLKLFWSGSNINRYLDAIKLRWRLGRWSIRSLQFLITQFLRIWNYSHCSYPRIGISFNSWL